MEYTFNDWLEGKPEPTGLNWIYEKESLNTSQPKRNPVYLEISKAKKFTFDKALEFTLNSMKSHFLEQIENLNESKRKLYIEKTIQESEKHYSDFDVRKLIDHSPPNKFEGINGEKYLQVKGQYEALNEGKLHRCLNHINKGIFAVVHFEMDEFYKEYLSNPTLITKSHNKTEKGESLAVRYKLLDEFFKRNEEFGKLKNKDQDILLGFILGCRADTAKTIKNQWIKYNSTKTPDGSDITQTGIDRFTELFDKIKKGDIL